MTYNNRTIALRELCICLQLSGGIVYIIIIFIVFNFANVARIFVIGFGQFWTSQA